ncbi:hypothetical protein HJG53_06800 [Sphingomonas sp. ID1715]|uniref:hypothetical protein n=1 Tax=Sphingomonas sp. ID1715 TaxID=1656898 RepID=UPI0014885FE1|nr:hypothetical protein [Sphingomonas sp. ID1715]NNM76606.1 hypothetical protein [Sphingomonas sp. ID1715]
MRDADLMRVDQRPLAERALVWLVFAAVLIFAAARFAEKWSAPPRIEAPIRQSSAGARDYDAAIAHIDRLIAGLRPLADQQPDDWLMRERIAHQLIARARLSGDFRDYVQAQQQLSAGLASATPGSGPHLSQAALALSTHRLALTERMLEAIDRYAVPPEAEVREGLTGLRGDIAFYRGRYRAAVAAYAALPQPDQRMAIFLAKTGQPEQALGLLNRIERSGLLTGQMLAQIALLRGTIELQRGSWDAAEAAFGEADRRFPRWWLVAAHRAQMQALRGRTRQAIRAFEAVARRNDDPALRDAIASLYRAAGDYAGTELWAGRAAQGWAERLKLLPEAALGHAVEHELAFGTPARALELARRDFALRPHGATAIALGWALIANNRPAEALKIIDAVNGSSWQSAEQHLVAARAHALLGDSGAAEAEQDEALALNPHALDATATLLWYGH